MQRSTESRMDYEYNNKSGPVDLTSPFMNFAANSQLQRSRNLAQKRSYTDFKISDQKSAFPSLRQPTSQPQTFLFSQPPVSSTKPLPATPLSAFHTPRKFDTDYDSSGIENPSSPENADSEATPDNMGLRTGLAKATSGMARLLENKKDKEIPLVRGISLSPSKITALQPYSHGVEKRRKRTRRDGEKRIALRKGSSGTDTEDDSKDKNKQEMPKPAIHAGPGPIAAVLSFIESHPDLPHVLSFYAQLLLNVFLVFFFIYIIYSFWATIQSDVDKKSEEAVAEILATMAICAQNYRENRCGKETRMPALETVCSNWEQCMNQNPHSVGRAKVSAHTFAEIFNSFIEPISYKAMIFSMIIVFGCVAVSNFAFGFFRNKAHLQPPPYQTYMATPMRHPSGTHDAYWHGYQSPMIGAPQPSAGAIEPQTAVRRLDFKQ